MDSQQDWLVGPPAPPEPEPEPEQDQDDLALAIRRATADVTDADREAMRRRYERQANGKTAVVW